MMAAEDHLNCDLFGSEVEWMHPRKKYLTNLKMRDYGGTLGELKFQPGGEHDERVKALAADIKENGFKEPIEIGPGGYLHNGHHRYLAAKKLNKPLPVRWMDNG